MNPNTTIFTIEELQKLASESELSRMHAREKLDLMDKVLGSLSACDAIPLSQNRLDLDHAHFVAADAIQASVIAGGGQ